MNVTPAPGQINGTFKAPPSKSFAHRLLIAASLAGGNCKVTGAGNSDDVLATEDCLKALLSPDDGCIVKTLRVRESGSTLRFMLPVAGALGKICAFVMEGRLPERPMDGFVTELQKGGMNIAKNGNMLLVSGKLTPGKYTLPGNVSSQFVSGLLLALPLLEGESEIVIDGKLQSADYVEMTLAVLRLFGVFPERTENGFLIKGGYKAPEDANIAVEGDWSGAAILLCAGAFSKEGVTVTGLDTDSVQGDRRILDILGRFGARVTLTGDAVSVSKGRTRKLDIDASQIPDLVPALAVLACGAKGETRIINAERLRYKETDRLFTTCVLINALGGTAFETPDGLTVHGTGSLEGGSCDSFSDHRIAMAAALASCISKRPVSVTNAECVSKSFPGFWEIFKPEASLAARR